MPTKVTDPGLLSQLNGSPGGNKVTDSAILAQLNSGNDMPHPNAIMRGAADRMLGVEELANNLGVGKHLGIAPNEDIEAARKELEKQGKGTGIKGTLGEIAGDPVSWMGGGMFKGASSLPKIAEAGARTGVMSGLTGGGAKDLKENVKNAVGEGVGGAMLAPAVSLVPGAVVKAGKAAMHPVETAGKLFKVASNVSRPVIQPIARRVIEGDNPLTREPGLKSAMQSDAAKEGMRLGKKLGLKFTAGELTGNSTARSIEDTMANSARYGERFAQANEAKTNAIVSNFNKTLDTIYPKSVSRTEVGDRIGAAYEEATKSLVNARRAQAAVDFGEASEAVGGKSVISPHNFIGTLKNFIAEGEGPLATPAQRAATKQAKSVLDSLKLKPQEPSVILDQYGKPVELKPQGEPYRKITVKDLQNGLAAFGEGAYSGGGIWKSLSTAADRRFSNSAKAALQEDLNEAANTEAGPGAEALKKARDNYLKNSNKISDIEKSTLGKLVGSAEHDSEGKLIVSPEKIADKFAAMQPTEIKNTLRFLDKYHPDVAQAARRYTLERSLRSALESRGQRGQGGTKSIAKSEFVKSLPDDEKLNALLGDKAAAKDIRDVAAAVNRMIDYGAEKSGSQTFQRGDVLDSISKWGKIKGAIYRSIISDSIVEDLLNPEMRLQLVKDAEKVNKATP